jgi:hypothetical protein
VSENCFSILISFNDKKLIGKLYLINLLIISSISFNFKGCRIYLLELK